MELVAGEPLSAVLARTRRLSVPRTLDVLEQTGRALQARARPIAGAPGHQARQPADHPGGPGEDHRLRHRQGRPPGPGDQGRHGDGHRPVPVPGAGGRAGGACRHPTSTPSASSPTNAWPASGRSPDENAVAVALAHVRDAPPTAAAGHPARGRRRWSCGCWPRTRRRRFPNGAPWRRPSAGSRDGRDGGPAPPRRSSAPEATPPAGVAPAVRAPAVPAARLPAPVSRQGRRPPGHSPRNPPPASTPIAAGSLGAHCPPHAPRTHRVRRPLARRPAGPAGEPALGAAGASSSSLLAVLVLVAVNQVVGELSAASAGARDPRSRPGHARLMVTTTSRRDARCHLA